MREVQTVSNSFAPEFGGTAGDIFNVITNSGSNQFHGEFSFIGRPPDWSARPILLASNKPNTNIDLHDYAFNSGGPIKKDKLFIFGAYEHLLRGTPMPVTIDPAAAAQIGIPASQLATAPTVQHVQFLDLRVDWQISEKHQVFFRYDYFRNEYPFNTANGGLNALSVGVDFHDRAHIGGFQLISSFSPTAINELRASEPYRNEHHVADPITGTGPEITITGIANFGGTNAAGDRYGEKIPSFSDNFTKVQGAHTIKAGFAFQMNNDNQIGDTFSQYTFPSIASYLAAKNGTNPYGYSTFQTVLGMPGASYKSYFYDFYVQDTWQLRPNLTMIYGVRWDRFQAPAGEANAPFAWTQHFTTPNRDWAPRLGLAWQFTPRTVLRASSGLFYEAPPTNLWYNSFINDGSTRAFTDTFSSRHSECAGVSQRVQFSAGRDSSRHPQHFHRDARFQECLHHQQQHSDRAAAHAERQSHPRLCQHRRPRSGVRAQHESDQSDRLAGGRPAHLLPAINAATRLYPQFNGITLQDVGAISNYNAMVLSYTHRSAKGYEVSANYTWSHSISDAPDANSFEQSLVIENPYSRAWDRGNTMVEPAAGLQHERRVRSDVPPIANGFAKRLANDNQLTVLANLAVGDEQNEIANLNLNLRSGGSGGAAPGVRGPRHAAHRRHLPGGYALHAHPGPHSRSHSAAASGGGQQSVQHQEHNHDQYQGDGEFAGNHHRAAVARAHLNGAGRAAGATGNQGDLVIEPYFHCGFLPRLTRFASSRYAPGTPEGNCRYSANAS